MWFAFRFYLCIQSQLGFWADLVSRSCDLLSDFIFVFNHNISVEQIKKELVVICFQILSLYSITTFDNYTRSQTKLWFAFRFYLCIQSQRKRLMSWKATCCDLLSDFIFVFNHNSAARSKSTRIVVICFQILSLYSITTSPVRLCKQTKLWFAFRFYLCIQSQLNRRDGWLRHSCDLLSDFIFVFNHNNRLNSDNKSNVVICFQILSLYSITTIRETLFLL